MTSCVWLKPELVAQIEFTEWTPDDHLRHSKFVGLREHKVARGSENFKIDVALIAQGRFSEAR